jgi:hypothetical protein
VAQDSAAPTATAGAAGAARLGTGG